MPKRLLQAKFLEEQPDYSSQVIELVRDEIEEGTSLENSIRKGIRLLRRLLRNRKFPKEVIIFYQEFFNKKKNFKSEEEFKGYLEEFLGALRNYDKGELIRMSKGLYLLYAPTIEGSINKTNCFTGMTTAFNPSYGTSKVVTLIPSDEAITQNLASRIFNYYQLEWREQ